MKPTNTPNTPGTETPPPETQSGDTPGIPQAPKPAPTGEGGGTPPAEGEGGEGAGGHDGGASAEPQNPPAAPAEAGLTQQEREDYNRLKQNWNAVQPFVRETADGQLELVPLPGAPAEAPPAESGTEEGEDAQKKRRRETEDTAAQAAKAYTSLAQRDLDIEAELREESAADPLRDKLLLKTKQIARKVPIEKRDKHAWKTAKKMAQGELLADYQKVWMGQATESAKQDLVKQHGFRIPRSTPKKTATELAADLSEREILVAKRQGITPEQYAQAKARLKGGQ